MANTAPAAAPPAAATTRTAPVTVAICTRGRPDALRRVLSSVGAQQPAAAQVLVVDSAPPNDAAQRLVRTEFPQFGYQLVPVHGLDFARNHALAEATQEIVAFVDDDVVLEAGAIARLAKVFVDFPRAGACTGRVFASLGTDGQRLFEGNGGLERGARRVRLPADGRRRPYGLPVPLIAWTVNLGSGGCLAVRRSAALALGGFDEALDLGDVLPGGGDHDMFWRVLGAGLEVVYEPMVRAKHAHLVPAEEALALIVGRQKTLVALLRKSIGGAPWRRRAPLVGYLVWRLLKPGLRLLPAAAGRDPLPPATLLRVWMASWKGLFAYGMGRRVAAGRRRTARR